jgi:hypothetical protein
MEPEPQPQPDTEAWQHQAIDHARDGDWAALRLCVLPPGQPRMPDELLNGLPGRRSMTVLHQLAFHGANHGAEPALRALVDGGCRLDPNVRTPPTAKPSERDMTAPDIARTQGHAHMAALLEQLPDLPPLIKWRYKRGDDHGWQLFSQDADAELERAWDAYRLQSGARELTIQVMGQDAHVDLALQISGLPGGGGQQQQQQPMRIKRCIVPEESSGVLMKQLSASMAAAPANFPSGLPTPEDADTVTQFYWHGEEDDSWIAYEAAPNDMLVAAFRGWKQSGGASVVECSAMHSVDLDSMLQFQTADPSRQRRVAFESTQWFWQGDAAAGATMPGDLSPWVAYTTSQAMAIEAAYRGGAAGAAVTHGSVQYHVDFSAMQQFKASNRFHRRDVRRRGPKLRKSGGKSFNIAEGAAVADVDSSIPAYWATDRAVLRSDVALKALQQRLVEVPAGSDTFEELQRMLDSAMYRGSGPDGTHGPHGSKFGLVPGCRPDGGVGDPARLELVRVERNENAFLWQKFAVRCAEVQSRAVADEAASTYLRDTRPVNASLRCDERPRDHTINEIYAFHGTGHEHIDAICRAGFDGRIPLADSDFGRAIYFAEHASKSNQCECSHALASPIRMAPFPDQNFALHCLQRARAPTPQRGHAAHHVLQM